MLILYQLPVWVKNPVEFIWFMMLLVSALIIDSLINFIRFKKPVCAVSAAVTMGILQVLTPGVPLWGKFLEIVTALVIGKHIWGGTGKNWANPAIIGVLFLSLIFKINYPIISPSILIIPAIILSLPFIMFRPFAGLGLIAGMTAALLFRNALNFTSIISSGVFFWGSLIITDPVSTTPRPAAGFTGGFLVGFLPLFYTQPIWVTSMALLIFNAASFLIDRNTYLLRIWLPLSKRIKKIIPYSENSELVDLTGEIKSENEPPQSLTIDSILEKIREADIFGMGGGGYSVYDKIKSVLYSGQINKYLIVNAVECDPGLIHDRWIIEKFIREISLGIDLLKIAVPYNKIYLAVKKDVDTKFPEHIEIIKVKDFYPAGYEKILIKKILKIDTPPLMPPSESGILILNIQTVFAVYEAVYLNKKADSRYITAANLINKVNQVARVKLKSKITDIFGQLFSGGNYPVFAGGVIMQAHRAEEEETVDKNLNFIALSRYPLYKESELCSNCSRCISNCPMGLRVNKIAVLVDSGSLSGTTRHLADNCILCGSCSYICPAGKDLASRMRKAKEYI